MEVLSQEYLKMCGLEPATDYPEFTTYRTDRLIVTFCADGSIVFEVDDLNNLSVHQILDAQNYTIEEFKNLCYGLRIQLHTPLEVGQTPGHYGC